MLQDEQRHHPGASPILRMIMPTPVLPVAHHPDMLGRTAVVLWFGLHLAVAVAVHELPHPSRRNSSRNVRDRDHMFINRLEA